MKRILLFSLLAFSVISGCKDDDENVIHLAPDPTNPDNPDNGDSPAVGSEPLTLSVDFGVHPEEFTLSVLPVDASHKIYYAVDGPLAVPGIREFPAKGMTVRNSTSSYDYSLTPKVINFNSWEQYNYGYLEKGMTISLVEVDADGNEVARKRGTYIVSPTVSAYDIPVICLSAPVADWIGTDSKGGLYNTTPNGDNDSKYRAHLEIYDMLTDNSFSCNTQMKRGGNWTRSYPCRTINVNFNKDENGEKNKKLKFELFRNRTMQNGSGDSFVGKLNRFRLHSGGNMTFASYISDAFVHEMCRMKANFSTTAYQPCMLYLNAEYWGLYLLREHYSDVFFEYNYGVDKDNVQYVDKVYNGSYQDPSYARYHFNIQEGKEKEVLAELDKLYDLLGYDYSKSSELDRIRAKNWDTSGWEETGEGSKYAEFCKLVDVESLIDVVLVQGYCANWDFMYNNLRMWRSKEIDPQNEFSDGRWRFMLHDVDFAFEDGTADNNIKCDDGYTGYDVWEKRGLSYFDYYMGNAYLNTGSVLGYLKPYNYLLLYLPAQNPEFKKLLMERAEYIAELFEPTNTKAVWDRMVEELEPYYPNRVKRWGHSWHDYGHWKSELNSRRERISTRAEFFMSQVKSAFKIE